MTGNELQAQIEAKIGRGGASHPFSRALHHGIQAAMVTGGDEPLFRKEMVLRLVKDYRGGAALEETRDAFKLTSDELAKSRSELEKTINEVNVLTGRVLELLATQITEVREARMALTRETATVMDSLRDVRKFFLESHHHEEVARLKEFVGVCQDLKAIAQDGTLETVTDAILKLSVKP